MESFVQFELSDNVGRVTLNRPAAGNALNLEMARELMQVALRCEGDPDVRAVVLTGAGKVFCVGGDLRAMDEQAAGLHDYLNELTTCLHAAITCFARMNAPVIAAVNGTAAGAGLGLVAMADLAIAAAGAKFTSAYTAVALTPDAATSFLLPRAIGRKRAMEMMIMNRALSSAEALSWGLVNQVVADEQLLSDANRVAAQLAGQATQAFGLVKALLNAADPGLETHMALEGRTIARQASTSAGREGMRAFIEKRKPNFS